MGKVALKDKFNLGLANIPEASFFGNTWQLMQTVAPEAYDGYMVYTDSAQWWETNNPGVKFSAELYHKNRQAGGPPLDQYILAIGSMMAWEKAIRLAYEAVGYEGLNGKAVYDHGWTKVKDFDCMKIFPPLTFSAERTRGNEYVRIIQMHKGKNPTALTDYEKAPWVMKVLAEEE